MCVYVCVWMNERMHYKNLTYLPRFCPFCMVFHIFFCHIHPTTFLFLFFRTLFCFCLLLVRFFRRNFFCSARCEHLHLQHISRSLYARWWFFLQQKGRLLCMAGLYGLCEFACVCLCWRCCCCCVLFVLWNASTDSFSMKVSSNRKTTAPKWEMRRWFWPISSCHDASVRVCVCVMCIDSNDDVLFFTLFDTLFTSYFNAWTEKFGFSVAALSRCCSPFLGVLFVSYELDHRNKPSYHRPVLRVTFALSLLFSFVRWYCCCLQFIYFFGVFVLFFGLPSIISGIN